MVDNAVEMMTDTGEMTRLDGSQYWMVDTRRDDNAGERIISYSPFSRDL